MSTLSIEDADHQSQELVIGYLEPHRRPETSAQIGALKEIP